jgi:hypothetical protein
MFIVRLFSFLFGQLGPTLTHSCPGTSLVRHLASMVHISTNGRIGIVQLGKVLVDVWAMHLHTWIMLIRHLLAEILPLSIRVVGMFVGSCVNYLTIYVYHTPLSNTLCILAPYRWGIPFLRFCRPVSSHLSSIQ